MMSNKSTMKKHELVKQNATSDLRCFNPKTPATVNAGTRRPIELHPSSTDKYRIRSPSPVPHVNINPPASSLHSRCETPQHLRPLGFALLKDRFLSSKAVGISGSSIASRESCDSGIGLSRDPSRSSLLGRTSEEFDNARLSPLRTSHEMKLVPAKSPTQTKILDRGLNDLNSILKDSNDEPDENSSFFLGSPTDVENDDHYCLVKADHLANLFQDVVKIEDDVASLPRLRSSSSISSNKPHQHICHCHSQHHQHYCTKSIPDDEKDGPFELPTRRTSSSKDFRCDYGRRFSNDREMRSSEQSRRKWSVPTLRRYFIPRDNRRRTTVSCVWLPRKRANTCPADMGASHTAQSSKVVIKRAIPKRLRKQCTEVLKVCTHSESHFEEVVMNLKCQKIDHELQILRETHLACLVKQNLPEFTKMTNWNYLLSHVIANDLADPNTQEKLMQVSMTTIEKSNHFYIQVLPSKGGDAYSKLYKCLCDEKMHSGHQHLASLLRQGLQKPSVTKTL